MKKKGVWGTAALLGGMVLLGAWLGSGFRFGLGGGGVGSESSGVSTAGTSLDRAKTVQDERVVAGVLTIRIEGDRLLVAGREMTAAAIAALAVKSRARVDVERAEDATVRANDALLEALHKERIHPRFRPVAAVPAGP